MNYYVAWMAYEEEHRNYQSVHIGTLKECKAKAKEIHKLESWIENAKGRSTVVRITYGPKQLFTTAFILA